MTQTSGLVEALETGTPLRFVPDDDDAELLNYLGRGEVRVSVGPEWILETRFPGVWLDGNAVEVAPFPSRALAVLRREASEHPDIDTPPDAVNARVLLADIRDHAARVDDGAEPHAINLGRLPLTSADRKFLAISFGHTPVDVVATGYGESRMAATRLRHVWSVAHFNASGDLIADTIEIAAIPVAALATPEDMRESAARLRSGLSE